MKWWEKHQIGYLPFPPILIALPNVEGTTIPIKMMKFHRFIMVLVITFGDCTHCACIHDSP